MPRFCILLVLCLHVSILLSAVNGDIVGDTCKKLVYAPLTENFCIESLGKDPSSHNANLQQLNLIAIRHGRENITYVESYIQKLLKSQTWSVDMEASLRTCLDMFSNARFSLDVGMQQFNDKEYGASVQSLRIAAGYPSNCELYFKEAKLVSPLTNMNNICSRVLLIPLKMTERLFK